jgi:chemotaxis protein methyltransferase CheR
MSLISTEQALALLSKRLCDELGIFFDEEKYADLLRRLQPTLRAFASDGERERYLLTLAQSEWKPGDREALIDCLTIGESYFFRDSALWEFMSNSALPELIRNAKMRGAPVSIWSAACCTGEEPYTVSMLINTIDPTLPKDSLQILGTDLNSTFVERARKGQFSSWSLRATPENVRARYFSTGDQSKFQIAAPIRDSVRFAQFNLMDLGKGLLPPGMPSCGFDLVFCRNVLIYFSRVQARATLERLHNCLSDNGVMILTPTDIELAPSQSFSVNSARDLIFLRKRSTKAPNNLAQGERTLSALAAAAQVPVVSSRLEIVAPAEAWVSTKRNDAPTLSLLKTASMVERGDYQEAVNQLELILRQHDCGVDFYVLVIKALANSGRISEGLEWVDTAIKKFSLNEMLYYWKAVLLQQNNKNEEAIQPLQQAIFVDSKFVMGHFAMFMLLNRLKQP